MDESFIKQLLSLFLFICEKSRWTVSNQTITIQIRRFGSKVNGQVVDKDNNFVKGYWLLEDNEVYEYGDHMI
jgi:hypothetical protein